MGLSLLDTVHWAATAFIEVLVLALALRQKLPGRLPFFTVYLCILVVNEGILWVTYSLTGISSHASFYVYWTMQAIQVSIRGIVVYEICREVLSPYAGIWKLCRPLLIGLGLILAGSAVATARRRIHPISATTLMAERGLEFTVVGTLILGLIFCRYYGVRIDRHLAWIALGLGFYSAVQVANNTFLDTWLTHAHFTIWEALRNASFNIATIFWLVALWKPVPARQPAPVLLAPGEYGRLAPQMTLRLRELNTRLLEIWK
ncbi:MAG TPA: hypothetical protein VGR84_10390 [Candidatus Acidoferrales bacterium]|nr:hypothetical protein [Candidatus Acidoferrales bacterium]